MDPEALARAFLQAAFKSLFTEVKAAIGAGRRWLRAEYDCDAYENLLWRADGSHWDVYCARCVGKLRLEQHSVQVGVPGRNKVAIIPPTVEVRQGVLICDHCNGRAVALFEETHASSDAISTWLTRAESEFERRRRTGAWKKRKKRVRACRKASEKCPDNEPDCVVGYPLH